MATKQALRDLQSRLADRLQTAQTQPVSMAWLAVLVGEGHYLLPLAQSGEIFPLASVTPVPYTKPWFAGVVNLRGGLYGVVDLALFMKTSSTKTRSEQTLARSRLITLGVDSGMNGAVIVDGLLGLRRQDAFQSLEPTPSGAPAFFGQCFMDAQGQLWQEIDLLSLSHSAAFLDIGS